MIDPAVCDSLKLGLYAREVEKRFCKVYGNVISNYFDFNEDLISGAKEMLNSKEKMENFDSDLPSYQLAFLLSFGVQDTCLSARKFYESIMNNPKIIKKLSESNPIKLFCLEGESLPTVIGVCQVLNEIVKEIGTAGKFDFREIRIMIIDDRENWKRLYEYIVDTVNSYFTNIELILDSVEDLADWFFEEFRDRINELDILVVARHFAEDRIFNYNIMGIILKEMKEDAILFYFDCCNERYYANLNEISMRHSFSQVNSCQNLHASFEDLEDEQYHLDLPVSWDTDFQPVMFSTWIKIAVQNDYFPGLVEPIAFNELNSITPKKKRTKKERRKKVESSHKQSNESVALSAQTNIVIEKKKVGSFPKQSNEFDVLTGQTNIVIGKKKVNCLLKQSSESHPLSEQTNIVIGENKVNDMAKQSNEFDTSSEQVNLVNRKKKVKSSKNSPSGQATLVSGAKKVKTSRKQRKQSDSATELTNSVSGKQKVKSLTKLSNPDTSITKSDASKSKDKLDTRKSHEVISTLLTILNKQMADSDRDAKTLQKLPCSNVPSDSTISEKVTADSSNFPTTQTMQPNRKAKTATSSGKILTTNQEDEKLFSKETGSKNVSPSVTTASVSQKSKGKSSVIKSENSASKSTASKEKCKTKSIKKKSPTITTSEVLTEKSFRFDLPKKSSMNVSKTKKVSKNNATEKVKLNGKFARMDLEKKNKDERHKMRAKKASFAKHANFDYDD